MRDISTKADGSDSLTGGEFNSIVVEIENIARRAGITLDSPLGPDTDLFMLAEAVTRAGLASISYQDSGAANSFVLSPVQSFEQPTVYFDGMTVSFKAAATNTSACTINANTVGAVAFTQAGGAAFTAGIIGAGNNIVARFFAAANRFELISNTTPELSGPASPDQVAVYFDAGTSSAIVLTIEPGNIAPSAFTDQMTAIFKMNATNNGSGTHNLNVTGPGASTIVEVDGSNPVAGRLPAGAWVIAIFREVRNAFEIVSVSDRPQAAASIAGNVTSSSGILHNISGAGSGLQPSSYEDGLVITYRAPSTNTGSLSLNLNGIGSKSVRNLDGTNFVAGEVAVRDMITAQYVLSEDRFRAAVVPAEPVNPLSQVRSATITGPSTTTVTTQSAVVLNFLSPPTSDPIGFYSASKDTFEGAAGVEAVDIVFDLAGSFQSGDDNTTIVARILVNGVTQASQTVIFGQGLEQANCFAMDIPVSAGDTIEASVTKSGSANYTITSGTKLTVRASRLSA